MAGQRKSLPKIFHKLGPRGAWLLGWIAGDGCIQRRAVTITQPDLRIAEEQQSLLCDGSIRKLTDKRTANPCYELAIYNRNFVEYLAKVGIPSRKTANLSLPAIPVRLMPEFLRGYFEADGSVRRMKQGPMRMQFVSKSELILRQIKWLVGCWGMRTCLYQDRRAWRLYISGRQGEKLARLIYRDQGLPVLQCKFEHLMELCKSPTRPP